jgi:hypothetical protein
MGIRVPLFEIILKMEKMRMQRTDLKTMIANSYNNGSRVAYPSMA